MNGFSKLIRKCFYGSCSSFGMQELLFQIWMAANLHIKCMLGSCKRGFKYPFELLPNINMDCLQKKMSNPPKMVWDLCKSSLVLLWLHLDVACGRYFQRRLNIWGRKLISRFQGRSEVHSSNGRCEKPDAYFHWFHLVRACN